jgi:hypothetical protein
MVIPPSQGHQTDHCRGGSAVPDPPLVEQAWVFWLFATKDGSRARIPFCWWTMHVTPKPAQEGPDEEVATTTPPAVPRPVDPVALPPAARIGPWSPPRRPRETMVSPRCRPLLALGRGGTAINADLPALPA